MDIDAMRQAYLRAIEPDAEEDLSKENERLKAELDALQQRHNRVLTALQDSVDSVLRIAREGKSET